MKLYLTGSDNREVLLDIARRLQTKGHTVVTPYDVVDSAWTDHENLAARLREMLGCEEVVTTPPNHGAWGLGADKEIKVANIALKPVRHTLHFLPIEQN